MTKIQSRVYTNYKYKSKFLGIITYRNLVIIIISVIIIFNIINMLNISLETKITVLIISFTPLVGSLCINVNGDNIIDTLKIIILFYINRKLYIDDYYNVKKYLKLKNKLYKNKFKKVC